MPTIDCEIEVILFIALTSCQVKSYNMCDIQNQGMLARRPAPNDSADHLRYVFIISSILSMMPLSAKPGLKRVPSTWKVRCP